MIEAISFELARYRVRQDGSEGPGQCGRGISTTKVDECCQDSYYTSILATAQIMQHCSKNDRTSHVVPCDSDADIHLASPASGSLQALKSDSKSTLTSDTDNVDVEMEMFGAQCVTLQVQGMA